MGFYNIYKQSICEEGCLFVMLTSPKPWCLFYALGIVGKLFMNKGALSWFHSVLTYDGKVIEY